MTTRRDFVKTAAGAAAVSVMPSVLRAADGNEVGKMKPTEFMWAGLFHFGSHMWNDAKENDPLELDYEEWTRITDRMAAVGMNAIVVDVGEGVVWPSHPELAVEGSWPVEKFRAELARMRALGLEVIPKVNFSTTHDAWLKDYGRMVSTPDYYRVCADIVRDTAEIFDRPRLIHLGYDEEAAHHQRNYSYAVIRQGELWWHDFLWFVKETEKTGARPWIWSDYMWNHEKEFLSRMPKSVLQSNWYYGKTFDADECARLKKENPKDWSHGVTFIRAYETLEKAGFDQVAGMHTAMMGGAAEAFKSLFPALQGERNIFSELPRSPRGAPKFQGAKAFPKVAKDPKEQGR